MSWPRKVNKASKLNVDKRYRFSKATLVQNLVIESKEKAKQIVMLYRLLTAPLLDISKSKFSKSLIEFKEKDKDFQILHSFSFFLLQNKTV